MGLAYPSSELSRRGVEPLFDTVMQEVRAVVQFCSPFSFCEVLLLCR